jgi:hypothetical protein
MLANNDLPSSRGEALAQGLLHYFTGRPCKHGHVANRFVSDKSCMACKVENSRSWRSANPEKTAAYDASARAERLSEFKGRVNGYYERNRSAILARKKDRREANLEEFRERDREYQRVALSTPKGKLENAISTGVHRGIIHGSKASRSTFAILGYSLNDLISHLESQFKPGMSWENYGRGGWHVDHKLPRAAFNYETPDDIDFKRCWALENLQPLWEKDNFSKGAKLTAPFQPSFAIGAPTKRA